MKKPGTRSLSAAVIIACFLPILLSAQETPLDAPPPLIISGVNQAVIIDRLIAARAYRNIKAGRPADHGIDFALLDKEMERYRPELEKFDPAYYGVLWETYERMKAYVTDPNSDFVRAVQNPGSVEFEGRNPLPAAAFVDTASQAMNATPPGRGTHEVNREAGRSIGELEPLLSDKAKKTLSDISAMPETTVSAREAKLRVIEEEIAAWEKNCDRLEAAVMLEILRGMCAPVQPDSTLPRIDADALFQEEITRETR